MPIYAYRCESCGHAQDVLQKLSDPLLTTCPACGAGSFRKQLTAAGFQLKGSGWYATDFKHGAKPPPAADAPKIDGGASPPAAEPAATPAPAAVPAPAASPSKDTGSSSGGASAMSASAGGSGGPCACH